MTTAEVKECTRNLLRGVTLLKTALDSKPFDKAQALICCRDSGKFFNVFIYCFHFVCQIYFQSIFVFC